MRLGRKLAEGFAEDVEFERQQDEPATRDHLAGPVAEPEAAEELPARAEVRARV
jgi:hypothetical protein